MNPKIPADSIELSDMIRIKDPVTRQEERHRVHRIHRIPRGVSSVIILVTEDFHGIMVRTEHSPGDPITLEGKNAPRFCDQFIDDD